MKLVIQRVKRASVTVNDELVGNIDKGLLILIGFTYNDTIADIEKIIKKVINLRIFDDENGIMNKSVLEVGGSILSVSQFTLYADTTKGRRPSYINALNGEEASKLYDIWNKELKKNSNVETGIFGADMQVSLVNDGPVTIIMESEKNDKKQA